MTSAANAKRGHFKGRLFKTNYAYRFFSRTKLCVRIVSRCEGQNCRNSFEQTGAPGMLDQHNDDDKYKPTK